MKHNYIAGISGVRRDGSPDEDYYHNKAAHLFRNQSSLIG